MRCHRQSFKNDASDFADSELLLQDFVRRYTDDTLEKPLAVGNARIGIWDQKRFSFLRIKFNLNISYLHKLHILYFIIKSRSHPSLRLILFLVVCYFLFFFSLFQITLFIILLVFLIFLAFIVAVFNIEFNLNIFLKNLFRDKFTTFFT